MGTTRLSAAEIVNELRSVLADDGWLTTSTAPSGPVTANAELGDIAQALHAHCQMRALPPAAIQELERAANAAARAQALEGTTDPVALYSELGTCLAYLVQARGACMAERPGLPPREDSASASSPAGERMPQ